MYACAQVSSGDISEIDPNKNVKFQFNTTNEMVFLNMNSDILTPIITNPDPIFCPSNQPIPRHIPGIPEKLLAKHRLAGTVIPRPLINKFMVDPPISDTERICRQLLLPKEEKVETTRVEELMLGSEQKKQNNGSGEDIERVFNKPSDMVS